MSTPPTLPRSIVDPVAGMATVRVAIDLGFKNKFFEAEAMLKPWVHVSMYHAVAHGTVLFLQAVMGLERVSQGPGGVAELGAWPSRWLQSVVVSSITGSH